MWVHIYKPLDGYQRTKLASELELLHRDGFHKLCRSHRGNFKYLGAPVSCILIDQGQIWYNGVVPPMTSKVPNFTFIG